MIGTTISHYTILEKLGEGGMGVVYKALDTRLDRTVALKFLSPQLASSEQDKARFLQEARLAAALSHPNICSILDVQEHEGRLFIVMEFLDGRSLREHITSLSLREAAEISIQIAEGLAAAHDKGITHRDIKPENIMVRRDGIVQIMDFGLAKLRGNVNRLTREGSTIGTIGYMAPEQVQGRDADHRADIFALGVVLYELFTGRTPFTAAHETALMYEIVNVTAPPMVTVRPDIDPEIERIVLGCLEKEPNDRTQSAKQVAVDFRRVRRESGRPSSRSGTGLHDAQPHTGGTDSRRGAVRAGGLPGVLPWALAGLMSFIAIGTLIFHFMAPDRDPGLLTAALPPPDGARYVLADGGHLALSPDGTMLAAVMTDTSGKTSLWVRTLSSDTPRQLPETEGAEYPFWSPDNRSIGFFVPGKMKKVLAGGGPPLVICDAPSGRGGTWSNDDVILFSPRFDRTGIDRVSAGGGPVTHVTSVDTTRNMSNARWPHFLPDGKHFLYTTQAAKRTADFSGALYVAAIDGSVDKHLMDVSTNVEYRDGRLLFVRQEALVVQGFDAGSLELTGEARPVMNKVAYAQNRSKGVFSSSLEGILVYMGGTRQGRLLSWIDRGQNTFTPAGNVTIDNAAYLTADDSRILYDTYDPMARNFDIWMLEIGRGLKSRITFEPSEDSNPVPAPGGMRFVFTSWKEGVNLLTKSAAGNDDALLLQRSITSALATDWSSGGRYVLFQDVEETASWDIWYMDVTGDSTKTPFVRTEFTEENARFSPDAKWVTYSSDESARNEVYLRPFPTGQGKWQVSGAGGWNPVWDRRGKAIYYNTDQGIMGTAVMISGGVPTIGESKIVFRNSSDAGLRLHGVTADGNRLLVSQLPTSQSTVSLSIVTDWRRVADAR